MRGGRAAVRLLRLSVLIMCAALLGASGCSHETPWDLKNISGVMPDLRFTLVDADGRTVHGNDFRGKVAVLYFGYTNCPDVCPTTLAKLAQVLSMLGADADGVRVLFVSVDPKRDAGKVLATYAHAFAPQVVGLTGSQEQLTDVTKRYRVAYGYGKPDAEGNYVVFHSSAEFVFDRQGKARLLAQYDDKAAAIAKDVRRLLERG